MRARVVCQTCQPSAGDTSCILDLSTVVDFLDPRSHSYSHSRYWYWLLLEHAAGSITGAWDTSFKAEGRPPPPQHSLVSSRCSTVRTICWSSSSATREAQSLHSHSFLFFVGNRPAVAKGEATAWLSQPLPLQEFSRLQRHDGR